jgi:hypothetical protein
LPRVGGNGYAFSVALLACPFCRALYSKGEAEACPECSVALLPLERLPPSYEASLEDPPAPPLLPENEILPRGDFSRGRGALLVFSLLGLVAFFLPWVEMTLPSEEVRSGFDLARGRAGWLWGGAVAWFVLIPLVWTRRTINAMRGVRPIVVLFSSMSLVEVGMMILLRPSGPASIPVAYTWGTGFYATWVIGVLATLVALRFGGSLPPLPESRSEPESTEERILH